MKALRALVVLTVLALPAFAFAAEPTTLKELAGVIVTLLNRATGVLVAAALVAFLYGAAYNMVKAGERGSGALRTYLVWGVIILFVMVSIWGILNLLQQTLVNQNSGAEAESSGGNAGDAFFEE